MTLTRPSSISPGGDRYDRTVTIEAVRLEIGPGIYTPLCVWAGSRDDDIPVVWWPFPDLAPQHAIWSDRYDHATPGWRRRV